MKPINLLSTVAAASLLVACGGTPKCGVDVHYIQYGTVGGAGEATDASGALMTPSGGPGCTGSRPIVLYAHGTTIVKNFNLANLLDETAAAYSEAALIAATYAAQGYIVVAPNYAGFDTSRLAYHPYLNADQESKEMMDALSAARKALPGLLQPVQDSGKLFITGYSQGGHVAMATHKTMQAAGQTVTASAPHDIALKVNNPNLPLSAQALSGQLAGKVRQLAPTLFANYKFLEKSSPLRPFIGVGINSTRFDKTSSTAANNALNGGPTSTREDSIGLALQGVA